MIKVSVIVPVYNAEKYLEKCLNSLTDQNLKECEIICINDASTDSSLEILETYGSIYNNIQIYNNLINKGLSYSRNYGIRKAIGKYLLFVDADDWLVNNEVIFSLYNIAEKNNLELLRYRLNIDTIRDGDVPMNKGKDIFIHLNSSDSYRWEAVRNFVRKDFVMNNLLFFDEKIYGCEDVLFSTQCILDAERCMEIEKPFYFYNQHNGSITKSTLTSKNVEGFLQLLTRLYEIFCTENNINVKYSLLKLIKQISNMCKGILWKLDENLNYEFWDKNIVSLYENIFRQEELIVGDLIFHNWEKLKKEKKIYVYGAGKAAQELWGYTKDSIDYIGIIVTHNTSGQKKWNEIPIYEVTDTTLDKSALVLISITGSTQDEVKKILKEYDFFNIMLVGRST